MAKGLRILMGLMIMGLFLGLVAKGPAERAAITPTTPASQTAVSKPAAQDETVGEYELVAENETFELHANRASLAFQLVDKRSGYIWYSNLDEKLEEDRLNRTWTAFAQSGISIDYLDPKATDERNSITNSETNIDFSTNENGFAATVTFLEPSITLQLIVTLEADGVRVEVPADSIREENPDFRLGLLYVYPFFGATRDADVPGYMFLPDGSGTLIQFAAETKAQNMFYGRYYGADLGMISTLPWDVLVNRPYKLGIPVIGMVHGEKENAYIAVVEKGASYGQIHAHPAGIITNFNFMYNAFIYNQSYFQATNRSGAGVTVLQPETNQFDVAIHYRFLTGEESDYVGMARSYQQYLLDRGMLQQVVAPNEDIGIRLEFLGGEKEPVLFWERLIPMTTVEQMHTILNELDVLNAEVIYYGWQPLGASDMPPRSLRLDRNLGNLNEINEMVADVLEGNGRFYLYLDPQAALWYTGGYSERRDLAMSITNINLIGYNREKVNYYLNLDALTNTYTRLSDDMTADLNAGWALDGISNSLYSDFKENHFLNREQAIASYQALLAENDVNTGFYLPNDYLFGQMQAYFDIPISDSGYLYTTETVPFLQIVLSGYVPYYGPALNFSSNTRADLLRHVDYGVYPSYFLTQEATVNIIDTFSNWIYTSSYDQWGQEVQETYQWINSLLGPVTGAHIIAREALADDVVAVTYSNGQQIVVNYGRSPFTYNNLTVNAQDAIITEVQP
ncbi:MAG: hypothetical protein H6652_22945 [Ardenticatenaceae bacterium]|nr:hypothetical protein [Ardenticatenaceae bacterium]